MRSAGVGLAALVAIGTAAAPASAARPNPSPAPTFTVRPADPTNATSATFTWTPPAGVNETYTCALDGGKPANCNGGTVSYPAASQPPLADGTHTFTLRYKAQGTGGTCYKASTRTVQWTVDTKAPDAPTVDPVTSPTSNTSASVTYHVADPTTIVVACTLDSTAVPTKPTASCDDPDVVTGLSDGAHTLRFYAFDAAGNASLPGIATWSVDTTAPGYPVFTVQPHDPTNAITADFAWSDGDATTFT